MRNKYDLVIFDLDGTLLDTSEGILSAVKFAVEKHGLKELNAQELESFIGPPVQRRFREVYGTTQKQADAYALTFRNQYKDVDLLKATPYDGIFKLFERLGQMGIKTAIATYKRQDYTDRLLHYFGFDQYTDIIYGSDFDGKRMKSDIIHLCIKDAGVSDLSRVVMVGDTGHDALGAKELGVDFIAVAYGFGFHINEDIKEYDYVGIAKNIAEIFDIIQRVNR